MGKSSIRILGLSNPSEGIRQAAAFLSGDIQGHQITKLLNKLSRASRVNDILEKKAHKPSDFNFLSPTLLVKDDDTRGNMQEYDIRLKQEGLFNTQWEGYSFKQCLLTNNWDYLNCILIDEDVIDTTTLMSLEGPAFKEFEKSLGTLFAYMNHDYTMHGYGFATKGAKSMSELLHDHIDMCHISNHLTDETEILAAIFHNDLINKINELGVPIHASIIQAARTACTHIANIWPPNIQNYWLHVLRYALFPIMSEESQEVQDLKREFPQLNLECSKWGQAINREYIPLKSGNAEIPVRELRETILGEMARFGLERTDETESLLKNYSNK